MAAVLDDYEVERIDSDLSRVFAAQSLAPARIAEGDAAAAIELLEHMAPLEVPASSTPSPSSLAMLGTGRLEAGPRI